MLGLCNFIFASFSNEKVFTANVTITRVPPTFAKFAKIQKIFLKNIKNKKIIGSTKHISKYMYQGVVFQFFRDSDIFFVVLVIF